ncbi:CBS domain-containing protein [Gymnodinialimonas sp. 2305UL16-5]|uniref:CBS domain-containing protein n=1 Tax=Gymnodinialimonas mytili TaxID=3126503 RepID=UPI00309AEEDF
MIAHSVSEIVRRDVPILSPDTPIRRAAAMLVDAAAAAAPVIGDNGDLVGILSQKDCFRTVLHASYHREWRGNVAEHMSDRVVTIEIDEDIVHAAEMFLQHPHRVFPVLRAGRVEGLLYRSRVLAFLMQSG